MRQRRFFLKLYGWSAFLIVMAIVPASFYLMGLENHQDVAKKTFAVSAIASLVIILFDYFLLRKLTRPLVLLRNSAQKILHGQPCLEVPIDSGDEMGELAKILIGLERRLNERQETTGLDQKKLMALLSSLVEGVIAIDVNEVVVHINEAAGEIIECSIGECLYKPVWEAVSIPEVARVFSDTLTKNNEQAAEVILVRRHWQKVVSLHAVPWRDEAGHVMGAVMVLHDLTPLKKLERIRQEFLGNVSHEFKTPVTAIQALVETILDDPDMKPEDQKNFLQRIKAQSDRLGKLVNDVLTLSRLESARTSLKKEPVNLVGTVRQCVENLEVMAQKKSLKVKLEVPLGSVMIIGDAQTLVQCIDNLLDNALKHSSDGGEVVIRLSKKGGQAVIEVSDNGPGIEPIHLGRIFERFYRVDKGRSRDAGGTGLGLAIVKHVAQAHGGSVSIESEPGKGSRFFVNLPVL